LDLRFGDAFFRAWAAALEAGTLFLHGWYYDIGAGEVFAYNPATDEFERIG
jgi:carbonic anhydrase